MRIILILLLFTAGNAVAQKTIEYQGETFKIYPFEQEKKVSHTYYSRYSQVKKSDRSRYEWSDHFSREDAFLPLGNIADGKYLQLVNPAVLYFTKFRWDEVNHIDKKIPAAILTVKDGKLNGEAIFLSMNGDTIAKGFYKDNLAHGKWFIGMHTKNFTTFNKNIEDGPYYHEFHKYYKKKIIESNYSNGVYKNGLVTSCLSKDSSAAGIKIEEIKTVDEEKRIKDYKTTLNGVVIEKGQNNGYTPIGDWKYFYNEGQKKSVATFNGDTIDASVSLLEWISGLNLHPYRFERLEFNAIQVTDREYSRDLKNLVFNGRRYSTINRARCFGEEVFYFENGTKRFSYQLIEEEFVPDTLFSENGEPFFYMGRDEKAREFVLSYFDLEGRKIDEQRLPFEETKAYPNYKMNWKGLELHTVQNNRIKYLGPNANTIFFYDEAPSFEEAVAAGDTTFYTYVAHDGEGLLHEVYYHFKDRVRVEKQYRKNGYDIDNYGVILERRDYFNEDFTECHTVIRNSFGGRFRVLQEFDLTYDENYYISEKLIEFPPDKRSAYKFNNAFFPTSAELFLKDNYKKPVVIIDNYQVSYTMKGKPFTGDVDLSFGAKKERLKISENKIIGDYSKSFSELNRGGYAFQDRFGQSYNLVGFDLIPDLFEEISETGNFLSSKIESIKGSFVNGKKEGDWIFKNSHHKKVATASFINNHIDGELLIYYFQHRARKRRRHSCFGSSKMPRLYYLQSKSTFKNEQVQAFSAFNRNGLQLLEYTYANGQPSEGWAYSYDQYVWSPSARDQFSDSVHFTLENNQLKTLQVVDFNFANRISNFQFKNDEFDGLYVDYLDSGYWDNGKFTGVFANGIGYDRVRKEFIKDNLLYRIEYVSPDGYKLLQLDYDTTVVRLKGSVNRRYYISDYIKISDIDTSFSNPKNPLEARFTSFYDNGEIHAFGNMSNGIEAKKIGLWTYNNSDGKKVAEIIYLDYLDQMIEENKFQNHGSLVQYENGKAIYKAQVIDILEKYNCASADNYEIRQIRVLEDYAGGDTIKNPTRHHKTYYDMGVLQAEGELVNGIPEGVWKFYDREGGLTEVGLYKNGLREGRWLSGDLTGLGFIGDFCLATDNYEFSPDALKKNVNLTITVYRSGLADRPVKLQAYRND